MFRRIGLLGFRTARSDEGFEVRFRGMTKLAYQEKTHSLIIGVEVSHMIADYIVYFSELKSWEPPYENESISSEECERIKRNIRSALAFMKLKHIEQ